MKINPLLAITMILLLSLPQWRCSKSNVNCLGSYEFCYYINTLQFESSKEVVNDFLSDLDSEDSNELLQEIVEWLQCKPCVTRAEIGCNSCIYTLPAQSHIMVNFGSPKGDTSMVMDIVMDQPPRFGGYH